MIDPIQLSGLAVLTFAAGVLIGALLVWLSGRPQSRIETRREPTETRMARVYRPPTQPKIPCMTPSSIHEAERLSSLNVNSFRIGPPTAVRPSDPKIGGDKPAAKE